MASLTVCAFWPLACTMSFFYKLPHTVTKNTELAALKRKWYGVIDALQMFCNICSKFQSVMSIRLKFIVKNSQLPIELVFVRNISYFSGRWGSWELLEYCCRWPRLMYVWWPTLSDTCHSGRGLAVDSSVGCCSKQPRSSYVSYTVVMWNVFLL